MPVIDNNTPFQPHPTTRQYYFKDITTKRFGMLVVVGFLGTHPRGGGFQWACRCDCGNLFAARTTTLQNGKATSCGCVARINIKNAATRHGACANGKETAEFRAFTNARYRCENPGASHYANYGGRGIKFRFDTFEQFFEHIGPRPTTKHSLDRKDNNGHYEIGNVRWATGKEQSRNRRSSRMLTFAGKTQNLFNWADETGISDATIRERLKRHWCVSCSLLNPNGISCSHR